MEWLCIQKHNTENVSELKKHFFKLSIVGKIMYSEKIKYRTLY